MFIFTRDLFVCQPLYVITLEKNQYVNRSSHCSEDKIPMAVVKLYIVTHVIDFIWITVQLWLDIKSVA